MNNMISCLDNIDIDGLDDLANCGDIDHITKANNDFKYCYSLDPLIDQDEESASEKFLDKVAEHDVFELLKDLPPETVSGQKRNFDDNLALDFCSGGSEFLENIRIPDTLRSADECLSSEAKSQGDFCNEIEDLLTDSDFHVATSHSVDGVTNNWKEYDIEDELDSFGISNDILSSAEECRSSELPIDINHPLKEMMSNLKECDMSAVIEEIKECKTTLPQPRPEVVIQKPKRQKMEIAPSPAFNDGGEYRDFSRVPDEAVSIELKFTSMTGRPQEPFPVKLHKILEQAEVDGYSSVISWLAHGRAFKINNSSQFIEQVMPKYFYQTKISSFQRQLKIYGFYKLQNSLDKGAYCHELFLRGRPGLCAGILRQKSRRTVELKKEPNFYEMPPVDPKDVSSYNTLTPVSHVSEPRAIQYITKEGERIRDKAVSAESSPQPDPVASAPIGARTPIPAAVPVSTAAKSQKRPIKVTKNKPTAIKIIRNGKPLTKNDIKSGGFRITSLSDKSLKVSEILPCVSPQISFAIGRGFPLK